VWLAREVDAYAKATCRSRSATIRALVEIGSSSSPDLVTLREALDDTRVARDTRWCPYHTGPGIDAIVDAYVEQLIALGLCSPVSRSRSTATRVLLRLGLLAVEARPAADREAQARLARPRALAAAYDYPDRLDFGPGDTESPGEVAPLPTPAPATLPRLSRQPGAGEGASGLVASGGRP
jgi:hypothetical protein